MGSSLTSSTVSQQILSKLPSKVTQKSDRFSASAQLLHFLSHHHLAPGLLERPLKYFPYFHPHYTTVCSPHEARVILLNTNTVMSVLCSEALPSQCLPFSSRGKASALTVLSRSSTFRVFVPALVPATVVSLSVPAVPSRPTFAVLVPSGSHAPSDIFELLPSFPSGLFSHVTSLDDPFLTTL